MKTISLFRLLLILTSPGYGPPPVLREPRRRRRAVTMPKAGRGAGQDAPHAAPHSGAAHPV